MVVDALKLIEAHRESDGTQDYTWRVRGTNRGNELWVRLDGPDSWVMHAVNYSNAPVRVTFRCVASGPRESLVSLGPGVWVANPWVDLLRWPAPDFPQVMPPADERWECTDPAQLSGPNGLRIAQACQALGWS